LAKVLPINQYSTAVWPHLASDELQQRGLAGTTRTHDGSNLPLAEGEIEAVEDGTAPRTVNQAFDADDGVAHLFPDWRTTAPGQSEVNGNGGSGGRFHELIIPDSCDAKRFTCGDLAT
jgi:hypothetical protein